MKKKITARELYRELNNIDAIPDIAGQGNFTADQMIWFGEQVLKQLSERQNNAEHPGNTETQTAIDFAVFLTGHDKETIEQMFNDWNKNK